MSEDWIWISRWEDFQHYKQQRDRPPAWIKDYTKQMSDRRYLELTDRQRALLADLRRSFAVAFPWLPRDTRVISRHRHRQTFRSDLEALNRAGFIEFLSRDALETRLELLYSTCPLEVEVEVEKPGVVLDVGVKPEKPAYVWQEGDQVDELHIRRVLATQFPDSSISTPGAA